MLAVGLSLGIAHFGTARPGVVSDEVSNAPPGKTATLGVWFFTETDVARRRYRVLRAEPRWFGADNRSRSRAVSRCHGSGPDHPVGAARDLHYTADATDVSAASAA